MKYNFVSDEETLSLNLKSVAKIYMVDPNSTINNIKIRSVYNPTDFLIEKAQIKEIEIDGEHFDSVESLIKKINPLLFKKDGSGVVSKQNLQEITKNGNITDKDIITNEGVLGRDPINENLKFGKNSLKSITTGKYNTAIGDNALSKLKSGEWSTAIGKNAGANIESSENTTVIGTDALAIAKNTKNDVFIGSIAGMNWDGNCYQSITVPGLTRTPGRNVVIGDQAFYQTRRGYANTVIGWGAGRNLKNYGDHNTFIGYNITGLTTGSYGDLNVVIGANAPISGENNGNLIIHSQHTVEDNSPTVGYSTIPLIAGNFIDRWLRIGGKLILHNKYTPDADKDDTFNPDKMLVSDINGNVGIRDLPENLVEQKVFTSENFQSSSTVVSNLVVNAIQTGKQVYLEYEFLITPTNSYIAPFYLPEGIRNIVSNINIDFLITPTQDGDQFTPYTLTGQINLPDGLVKIPNHEFNIQTNVKASGFKIYVIS